MMFSSSMARRLRRRRCGGGDRTFPGEGNGGGEGWRGEDPRATIAGSAHASSCGGTGFGMLDRLRRFFLRFFLRLHHCHQARRRRFRRRRRRLRRRRGRKGRSGEGSPRAPAMLSGRGASAIGAGARALEPLASSPEPRARNSLLSAGSWDGTEPPPRPTPQGSSLMGKPSPAATATAAAAAAAAR